MNYIIDCPKCNSRVDEKEIQVGKMTKKQCPKCGQKFWVIGEINILKLVNYKDIKKELKGE